MTPNPERTAETSSARAIPREEISAFLAELEDYVVLRNFDVFVNLERGGDIDLLVGDTARAERALLAHLGSPLWITRRSYVHGYFYPWGHLDLITAHSWRGAEYISKGAVLAERRRAGTGVMRPRLAHEALISWLSKLLYGGFLKERYKGRIVCAARDDGAELRARLIWAAGEPWGRRLWRMAAEGRPEASAEQVGSLRRAVWMNSFRRDQRKTFQGWLAHWRTEAHLRLRPPLPWVAVLGPDGSRKTLLIEELARRLQSSSVETVQAVDHTSRWRFPALMCSAPTLLAEWAGGSAAYWTRLVHLPAKNRLLLSGTPYVDFLARSACCRRDAPRRLAATLSRFSPRPALLLLLDAPANVLQQRQPALPLEEAECQRQAYRALVRRFPEAYLIDAAQPLAAVADEAEHAVLACIARLQPPRTRA